MRCEGRGWQFDWKKERILLKYMLGSLIYCQGQASFSGQRATAEPWVLRTWRRVCRQIGGRSNKTLSVHVMVIRGRAWPAGAGASGSLPDLPAVLVPTRRWRPTDLGVSSSCNTYWLGALGHVPYAFGAPVFSSAKWG